LVSKVGSYIADSKDKPVDPPMPKTKAISVRVSAEIKDALKKAAERDHRSLASLVIKILVEWLTARKLIPDLQARKRSS
jgi:predicted HicB family RNase H-like nuclease